MALYKRYAGFDAPETSAEEDAYVKRELVTITASAAAAAASSDKGKEEAAATTTALPADEHHLTEFFKWIVTVGLFDGCVDVGPPDESTDSPELLADKRFVLNCWERATECREFCERQSDALFRTIRSKIPPRNELYTFHAAMKKSPQMELTDRGLFRLVPSGLTYRPADVDQRDMLIVCHNVYFFGQYALTTATQAILADEVDIEDKTLVQVWSELTGPNYCDAPVTHWKWRPGTDPQFVKNVVRLRLALETSLLWT